jgi:hypothetical protein
MSTGRCLAVPESNITRSTSVSIISSEAPASARPDRLTHIAGYFGRRASSLEDAGRVITAARISAHVTAGKPQTRVPSLALVPGGDVSRSPLF